MADMGAFGQMVRNLPESVLRGVLAYEGPE